MNQKKSRIVKSIERINDNRSDTWVCVELNCGEYNKETNEIDYSKQEREKIKEEILNIVNSEESDLYKNLFGERKFKYAKCVCSCSDCPDKREHWILHNDDFDWEE